MKIPSSSAPLRLRVRKFEMKSFGEKSSGERSNSGARLGGNTEQYQGCYIKNKRGGGR
jgi:hypothetical protein